MDRITGFGPVDEGSIPSGFVLESKPWVCVSKSLILECSERLIRETDSFQVRFLTQ